MENIFTEVKNRLSIKDVIEHYSNSLFNKDDKCHCPFPDHQDIKSPSLSILKDNNTFRCFGCDKSGSVVDFVMMYKGVDKIQAVKMLNEDFNLGLNLKDQNKKKFDIKKYLLTCEKDIGQTDYFIKRGLLPTTIKKHRLGYDKVKNAVTIPYNGKMNYGQIRYVNEKRFWKPPTSDVGAEPIYNENAINDKDGEPIFIVESPICAMSIEQYNSKAIAICGGGGVSKLDKALKGRKIGDIGFILALDNDEPGARYTDEFVAYFKSKRIKYAICNISGKEKDPNDLLKRSSEDLIKNIIRARCAGIKLFIHFLGLCIVKIVATRCILVGTTLATAEKVQEFTKGQIITAGTLKCMGQEFAQAIIFAWMRLKKLFYKI